MPRSALGQSLHPLERDGIIESASDPIDRRRRPFVLTDAGRATIVKVEPFWARAQKVRRDIRQQRKRYPTRNAIGIASDDRLSI